MTASTQDPSLRHRRHEQLVIAALLTPALTVVVALLIAPLLWLVWQSIRQDGGFTLEHYARFLTDDVYWRTFLATFRIAFTVTVATVVLGYPVAYVASQASRRGSLFILAMVVLPFWTSVLVRAYAWMILLQRRGLVNGVLQDLHLIDTPIAMINNEFGTQLATVHILLPFMVLPLYATMQKIPRELIQAGGSLGGSPFFVFSRVFLPLSLPGVVAGMMLVFVLTLGFYITPQLLGGGRTYMVSMLVSRNIELYSEWGAASSISVVLLICVFAAIRLASIVIPFERIMGVR